MGDIYFLYFCKDHMNSVKICFSLEKKLQPNVFKKIMPSLTFTSEYYCYMISLNILYMPYFCALGNFWLMDKKREKNYIY